MGIGGVKATAIKGITPNVLNAMKAGINHLPPKDRAATIAEVAEIEANAAKKSLMRGFFS